MMMVILTALVTKMTMIMAGLHLQQISALVKIVQIRFQIYQGKSRLAIRRFNPLQYESRFSIARCLLILDTAIARSIEGLDMFDFVLLSLSYLVGKSSMIVAQRTWGLPSSGISFITCSTCSVGNSPHRW